MTLFTVLGAPHTKGSTVSFLNKRGQIVTKTDSVGLAAWSRTVGWAAKHAGVPLAKREVPVRIEVLFCFPRQKVRPLPTVRPDLDKLLRALLDALAGVAYLNDAQVVEIVARKLYADDARTVIAVGDPGHEAFR